MIKYYLSIDIGASGGRHILGYLDKGKLKIEEVYRFKNDMHKFNSSLCWNIEYLFSEILNGLKKCSDQKKIPSYIDRKSVV